VEVLPGEDQEFIGFKSSLPKEISEEIATFQLFRSFRIDPQVDLTWGERSVDLITTAKELDTSLRTFPLAGLPGWLQLGPTSWPDKHPFSGEL
jgi:hypothetical protein